MFRDWATLQTYQIAKAKQTEYIDSVLKTLEDEDPNVVKGLQVKITATHAARLTGHWHFYSPAKVQAGKDTFTTPYEKPVLTHHDSHKDAIGRIKKATYSQINHPMISNSLMNSAHKNVPHDNKSLGYVQSLYPFLFDRSFPGLGKVSLVTNILDPNAIPKIVDGRYSTVSIGYDTNSLHCSVCHKDWLGQGPCDHEKGVRYKIDKLGQKFPMFLIFGDMVYGEVSYVNEPADDIANNEEVKRIAIPVMLDFKSRAISSKGQRRSDIVAEAMSADSNIISNPSQVSTSEYEMYYYDSKNKLYVSAINNLNQTNLGDTMSKLKDLLSSGTDAAYEQIKSFLPEEKVLKLEDLAKLEDSNFIGQGRIFPAVDIEHIDACKKLIDTFEDGDEKTELLQFLEVRKDTLETPVKAEVTEPVVEETKVDTNIFAFDSVNLTWSIPEADKINQPLVLIDTIAKACVKTYEDTKILVDGVIAGMIEEDKVKLLADFNTNTDKIQELEDALTAQKKEYNVLFDSRKTEHALISNLTEQLKDSYIDKILSLKKKESPTNTTDAVKLAFKDKSLNEIKTAYEMALIVTEDTDMDPSTVVADPTQKIEKTFDATEIESLKKNFDALYLQVKKDFGDTAANAFKETQATRIMQLENNLKNKQ